MSTYRVGNHQPQNVYRDDAYIGVMFTAEDAALVVEALNGQERPTGALVYETTKAIKKQLRILGYSYPSVEWDGALAAARAYAERTQPANSCTCSFLPGGTDPVCVVHQGRRARGPKPPTLGPGCICDGSGRTCPRHGAVM
jgi:hypothetical protein